MKQLFLMIGGVMAFLIVLGLFSKSQQSGNPVFATPKPKPSKFVTIKDQKVFVYLADNDESRKKGLSGRTSLQEDEGMLFVFNAKDVKPAFWMKGMIMPIDIIWINDGKIIQIDAGAEPPSNLNVPDSELKLYTPKAPIDYVLEVNSGFSQKKSFSVGDPVNLTNAI